MLSAKAYQLFSEKKNPRQVVIALNLSESKVSKMYVEYWKLKRLRPLYKIYEETKGKLGVLLKLFRLIKEKGMSIEQIVNAVEIDIHRLPYMGSCINRSNKR